MRILNKLKINIMKRPPHKKVNLRVEDILRMIEHFEYMKFMGTDRLYCDRVLRQLRKSINK